MEVKWILIGFFAVVGVFRAAFPTSFKDWITLKFQDIESRRSVSVIVFSFVVLAVLAGLCAQLMQGNISPTLLLVGTLTLVVLRLITSVLLSVLFSKTFQWDSLRLGPSIHALTFTYAVAFVLIALSMFVVEDASFLQLAIFLSAHLVGLIWYTRCSPAIQNIGNWGNRLYSLLYLCTLELVIIISFVN